MSAYNLLPNESYIMESSHVRHNGKSCDLVLTSLNLVSIMKKGIFKPTDVINRMPLSQIKVADERTQMALGDGGELDVYFKYSKESFHFYSVEQRFREIKAKTEAAKWAEAINSLVLGRSIGVEDLMGEKLTDVEIVTEAVKDTFVSVKDALGIKSKTKAASNVPTCITKKCMSCGAPISGAKGQIVRCQYCSVDQHM